ncbi:M20 family peptidase, partial [Bordetella hinzii]|nr:M20 family peptidase [Bordetella hinzii]
MTRAVRTGWRLALAAALLAGGPAMAGPVGPVLEAARAQEQGLLDTLRDLVNIESGSRDVHGVKR